MNRSKYIKIFSIRFLGYFLILAALAGIFWTVYPVAEAEVSYRVDKIMGRQFQLQEDVTKKVQPVPSNKFLPPLVGITPVNRSFSLVIPKINANSPVIANVDAGSQDVYDEALKRGVAHAAGTAYPGDVGNVFLFAHSSGNFWDVARYNAVFYLIENLAIGDEIDVFFNGKRYLYTVFDKKIVEADDTQYLNSQSDFPLLTLQTCWPPGTALKRLLVLARLTSF